MAQAEVPLTRRVHLELTDGDTRLPVTVQLATHPTSTPRPLVLLSHGGGGSHALYSTLSTALAAAGHVVVMPEHPGNHRKDNSRGGTHRNLVDRPRHLRLAAEAVQADPRFRPHLIPDRFRVLGHSLGGYTALALAGARAWDKTGLPIALEPDPRVEALVLLAPAGAFFNAPGALAGVTQPVLLLSAQHDTITPPWQAEVIRRGLPDPAQLTFEEIPGAGHFSFLMPFPAALQRPELPASCDPPGFDRAAFHRRLPGRILDFLEALP